jgi:hypothetical protein
MADQNPSDRCGLAAQFRRIHWLGHAAAAKSLRTCHVQNAYAAYFLFPFETMWVSALNKLAGQYKDKIDFYAISPKAHPKCG